MLSRKRQERKMMMKTAKTLGIAGSVPKRWGGDYPGGRIRWNIPRGSFCGFLCVVILPHPTTGTDFSLISLPKTHITQ